MHKANNAIGKTIRYNHFKPEWGGKGEGVILNIRQIASLDDRWYIDIDNEHKNICVDAQEWIELIDEREREA